MLQILNNIYAGQVLAAVSSGARTDVSQNSEFASIVVAFVLLSVGGGIALGCFMGSQRQNGRTRHWSRAESQEPRTPRESPFKRSPSAEPDRDANIYLWIEGRQEGPYTGDQVRQSLEEDHIPPDLPAWQEGQSDWAEVQSLVTPNHDPSPPPSPEEEKEVSRELEPTPSRSPQIPGPPVLLDPKLGEMLSEMIKRRSGPLKKK